MIDLTPLATQMRNTRMTKEKTLIDANLDLQAAEELRARNEATADRINQTAMGGAGNVTGRIGGGRYSRMQTWRPGGTGGLAKANASALTEARKKAAYAELANRKPAGTGGIRIATGMPIATVTY